MAEFETILVERRGAVMLVTLNRPEALNALSSAVLEDLIEAFAAFEADEGQRCAVVTGAGEKAFAAGADIKEMAARGAAEFYRDDTFARWTSHFVGRTRKPWIAAVNGKALAGGCELMLACDLAVASEDAAFGLPEVLRGLIASAGGLYRLPQAMPPRIALELVLWDVIPAFHEAFPEITLDLDVNDASIDLASGQFDAGIRMGEYIQRDMAAVRLTEDFRCVVVGSPRYLKKHGRPSSPKDLAAHECIRYRFPTARAVYRWEFIKAGRTYSVEARGSLTVTDHLSMLELAGRGVGLAYTLDLLAGGALRERRLEEVLTQHTPKASGLFLYFPAKSQAQPKLRAFIDFAKERLRNRH